MTVLLQRLNCFHYIFFASLELHSTLHKSKTDTVLSIYVNTIVSETSNCAACYCCAGWYQTAAAPEALCLHFRRAVLSGEVSHTSFNRKKNSDGERE